MHDGAATVALLQLLPSLHLLLLLLLLLLVCVTRSTARFIVCSELERKTHVNGRALLHSKYVGRFLYKL